MAQTAARPRAREGSVEDVTCRAYEVPTDQPEADGTIAWSSTTAVVATVRAGGELGTGWTYAGTGSLRVVEEVLAGVVRGADAMDVAAAWEAMVRACRNLGTAGAVAGAVSAVDVALWDLKARLLGVPLTSLLGRCRRAVPIYGSGGFTTYDDATLDRQIHHFVDDLGAGMVKIKIGESWGTMVDRDVARVGVARAACGTAALFVDANGGYTRKQAVRIGRRLTTEYGVEWFEEPVTSDDLAGLREVRDRIDADVAAGEYGYDVTYFDRMAAAGAVDCLQADATRCGGYTGWLRAAAVAAAHHLDISAHCAPYLHAPVAAAVPNLRHVEWFHDHARLAPMLFRGTTTPSGGLLTPSEEGPGHGFELREAEAERYRVV